MSETISDISMSESVADMETILEKHPMYNGRKQSCNKIETTSGEHRQSEYAYMKGGT